MSAKLKVKIFIIYIEIVSLLENDKHSKNHFWLTLPDFADALFFKRKLLGNDRKNQLFLSLLDVLWHQLRLPKMGTLFLKR